MNFLLILAILFAIVWLVAKVAFAVTGAVFHLLWVIAIILFVVWLFGKLVPKG